MEINVREHHSGPMFDARGPHIVHRGVQDAVETIAQVGHDDIVNTLQGVIRHPTPYYWTQIRDRAVGDLTHILDDSKIIYGPWLEGVGSKNKTTRFKGYFTFRKVKQRLEVRAGTIAERVMESHTRRLR